MDCLSLVDIAKLLGHVDLLAVPQENLVAIR
jgi:hypothetical protein